MPLLPFGKRSRREDSAAGGDGRGGDGLSPVSRARGAAGAVAGLARRAAGEIGEGAGHVRKALAALPSRAVKRLPAGREEQAGLPSAEGGNLPAPWQERRRRILDEAVRRASEELGTRPRILVAGRPGSGRSALVRALLRGGEFAEANPATVSEQDGCRTWSPGGEGGIEFVELPGLAVGGLGGVDGREALLGQLCACHACLLVAGAPGTSWDLEQEFVDALRAIDPAFPCLLAGSRVDRLAADVQDPGGRDRIIAEWGERLREACGIVPARFVLTSATVEAGEAHGVARLARLLVDALPAAVQARAARALDVELDRRATAQRLIRAATAATMGAAIVPLPLVDFVLITASQIGMLVGISRLYDRELAPREALHLLMDAGGSRGNWLGRSLMESFPKWIPGLGTLAGGLLEATMEAPLTMAIGETYLEGFARKDFRPDPREVSATLRRHYEQARREQEERGAMAWYRGLVAAAGAKARPLGRLRAMRLLARLARGRR